MAAEIIANEEADGYPVAECEIYILTDSAYTMGVVVDGWRPKVNADVGAAVRRKVRQLKPLREPQVRWVPGHVGLADNEHADFLANRGADASAAGRALLNLNALAAAGRFLPP